MIIIFFKELNVFPNVNMDFYQKNPIIDRQLRKKSKETVFLTM